MRTTSIKQERTEFGDFQTPDDLANAVCKLLVNLGLSPASIVEPTCGKGSFLRASESHFVECKSFLGYEINPTYAAEAQTSTERTTVHCEDFFSRDWLGTLNECIEPILILGNPPWVTNSTVGAIGGQNLPAKSNFLGMSGIDAITGKSNFDISEWMLSDMLRCLSGRSSVLAMLCKTAVARKVLQHAWRKGIQIKRSALYAIDAKKSFGAAVDACLLVCALEPDAVSDQCEVFSGLEALEPTSKFGFVDDRLVADVNSYLSYGYLGGASPLKWRSGVKHDCSGVMELRSGQETNTYINGNDESVILEGDYLYPMLKSSELTRGDAPSRYMLVTQSSPGEDTATIADEAPLTWQYLESHAHVLDARSSSIYRNRPRFSVFGVGPYSFAPWKVAISGFYKRLNFRCIGPVDERPVILDDTCYFLPCDSKQDAEILERLLNSRGARGFFQSMVFWDAKRPITASLLSSLDLRIVAHEVGVSLPYWSHCRWDAPRSAQGRLFV